MNVLLQQCRSQVDCTGADGYEPKSPPEPAGVLQGEEILATRPSTEEDAGDPAATDKGMRRNLQRVDEEQEVTLTFVLSATAPSVAQDGEAAQEGHPLSD